MIEHADDLVISNTRLGSRLLLGTGKFASNDLMQQAVIASKTQLVTVALKRISLDKKEDDFLSFSKLPNIILMPNTSGVRTAAEAVFAAELGREALQTNWVKLEIHPDPKHLMPDPIETFEAAKELVKKGFIVLPYINADVVLCKRLEDIGVAAVMPLGAPIGSNLGLTTKRILQIIIEQSNIPVIIDAGIGAPSHAAEAMEMGADAVLVNTAIAVAKKPIQMAEAFAGAVSSGRTAYMSGLPSATLQAQASSPLTQFLYN